MIGNHQNPILIFKAPILVVFGFWIPAAGGGCCFGPVRVGSDFQAPG